MLVEKAFAKLHGCYDNIIAGFTLESFGILTGAPTEMKFHRKTPDILVRVSNAFKNGHLVTAITNFMKGEKKEFKEEFGLIPAHAYTLLDVIKVRSLDIKLVKLRNPTTVSEWKGPWSRQSP